MATKSNVKEKSKTTIKEPKKYKVIMHNDDFTTMQFVVEILVDIFSKSDAEAEKIMLYVHQKGHAVVGVYPYDIAMTKTENALLRAKTEGYPFRMTVEEE